MEEQREYIVCFERVQRSQDMGLCKEKTLRGNTLGNISVPFMTQTEQARAIITTLLAS